MEPEVTEDHAREVHIDFMREPPAFGAVGFLDGPATIAKGTMCSLCSLVVRPSARQ
jgi:hypothetical protein